MKNWIRQALILVSLLLIAEVVARFALGLGKVPIYIESPTFEYIYAPNQHIKRFGNRIITNEFSMRSEELLGKDKVRILKLGDSVINGGSQTDHDSLASTILDKKLSEKYKESIRVLNIGANSWGPDNAFAYVKDKGHFNSSFLILVFSSHDLYDNMHFQKVVGVHPAWPATQPSTALGDGIHKYVVPWVKTKIDRSYNPYSYLSINTEQRVNTGWFNFFQYTSENQLELLVYLHPSLNEVIEGSYNIQGKKVLELLETANIRYIKGIEHMKDDTFYRDFIHLNNAGQKKLAAILFPYLDAHVKMKLQKENI